LRLKALQRGATGQCAHLVSAQGCQARADQAAYRACADDGDSIHPHGFELLGFIWLPAYSEKS
jgi:hypothetical protein